MASFFRFFFWLGLSVVAIVLGVMLGDYGPWYLAWILGTGLMILVAAMGGVLFEAQAEDQDKPEAVSAHKR